MAVGKPSEIFEVFVLNARGKFRAMLSPSSVSAVCSMSLTSIWMSRSYFAFSAERPPEEPSSL